MARNIEEFLIENEKQNNYLYVRTRVGGRFLAHQPKLGDQDIAPQNINKKLENLWLIQPD